MPLKGKIQAQQQPAAKRLNSKPSLTDLIVVNDHKHTELVRHYNSMTMSAAISCKSPSIYRLSVTDFSHEQMVEGLSALFMAVAMYFDESSLSARQANIVAEELLAHPESLKLEDLVVICKELKEQSVYSKLTPSKILKHIAEYRKRRTKEAIAINLNKTLDEKQEANIDDRIKKSVRKIESSNRIISEKNVEIRKFYK